MKKTIIIAAAAALLTACGADSTPTGTSTIGTTTIKVTNMQGGKTDITGVWVSSCFASVAGDFRYFEEFSGTNTYFLTEQTYTTNDGSCGNTATTTGTVLGTFTVSTDVTATGWINGTGASIAAPTAQNGTSTLPATPSATVLLTTVTTASGVFTMPATNPMSVRRAVDATNPTNIALYDIYDDGVTGLVADISLKATKQ